MLFNLDNSVEKHDLAHLDNLFTRMEMDIAEKEMPTDRLPGLDEFNWQFLKKCWSQMIL
jgi:hypothetical protein